MNPRSRRRSLITLTQFHDTAAATTGGETQTGGGQGGADAATTGLPPVFNAREHLADDGSFKADWHKAAGVSENIAKKFSRPEALARSYESLEKQINAKGVIIPGPNATQAERDAYYTALGRPAKPEEYGFVKPEKVKVGDKEMSVPDHAWDSNRAKAWQARLHEMGVPKDQAQKIMEAAVTESVTGLDMIEQMTTQSKATARTALVKEFGGEDGYKTAMAAAQRAAQQFGGDELVNHPGLGNDPVMIKALAKIGAATAERPGTNTRQQAGNNQLSAAEANLEARNLTKQIAEKTRADRQWANSPEAQQMKARKRELFKVANPER